MGLALFSRLVLFVLRLLLLRLDEGRWRFLFFSLCASLSGLLQLLLRLSQEFRHFLQPLQGYLQLLFKACSLLFDSHGQSVSEKGLSEQSRGMWVLYG